MHDSTVSSRFLLELSTQVDKKRISYCNEAEIESFVRLIIVDALLYLGIDTQVSLHYQETLVSAVEGVRKELKSDIWVVKTKSGVPIAVIEVKQPGYDKLNNKKVLGQVFDYMSNLRNSFGQCEVFGIVTTLEQWRVAWFPDTDEFAASGSGDPTVYEDLQSQFPVESTLGRDLHVSAVYKWDSKKTLPLIATVLLKSMTSQHRVVALLSSNKAYIVLRELDWIWSTIPGDNITNVYLTLPVNPPTDLAVLRQFHGGADGQVCLTLTKQFNLVVVKKFYDEELCGKECKVWNDVYKVKALSTKLLNSQCLIMPLVFHCIEIEEGVFYFEFNVSSWGRDPSSGLLSDERFDVWTNKIDDFVKSSGITITVGETLDAAVEALALHCCVHNDLEWRHVALLPVLHDNEVTGMKPVLIDLASVKSVESVEVARETMKERVTELKNMIQQQP